MQCPECTQRVRNLRNYYMKNSPVSVVGYPPWKVQRTMMLFYQGWREGVHQPTTRLRRAYGEQYMQAHMEPIIDPEELIVGQPDLHPLSDTEQVLHDQYDDIYRNVIPPNCGRADHMGLDYGKLLQVGVHGLLDEIHANDAKLDLFNADDLAKRAFLYFLAAGHLLCRQTRPVSVPLFPPRHGQRHPYAIASAGIARLLLPALYHQHVLVGCCGF